MPNLLDRLSARIAYHHAKSVYERFVANGKDAIRVQDRVLADMVRCSASSAFGRDHGFDQIRDYSDFARRVPVRSYDDMRPYIDRVVAGDFSALLGRRQKVLMFALTSGTTAEPKYIPVTPPFLSEYKAGWNAWGLKALLDHPEAILRGILQMASPMDERTSSSGIPCGAITGLTGPARRSDWSASTTSSRWKWPTSPTRPRATIPPCGLPPPRDVAWLIAANPATLIRLAETAAAHGADPHPRYP